MPRPSTSPCSQSTVSTSFRKTRPHKWETYRVLSHVERDLDVRLSSQVVDLGRLNRRDDSDQVGRVRQVCANAYIQVSTMGLFGGDLPVGETHHRSEGPFSGLSRG